MLKIVAGAITGSIAIITEAVHSSIDLLASIVAYFSVRKADEPADADHMYGHAKVENLAAAIEGMLILVGAGVIVFEAVRRLASGADDRLASVSASRWSASRRSSTSACPRYLYRQAALHDSPALEGDAAHLRADALTSVAVLVGLVLVEVTGVVELDSMVALLVAVAIVYAGMRILPAPRACWSTRRCPPRSSTSSGRRSELSGHGDRRLPQAERPPAGSARYIDVHLQFAPGRRSSEPLIAHELQDQIRTRIRGADVLVHLEPDRAPAWPGDDEP